MGHAFMGELMGHGADDAGLRIIEFRGIDPGGAAQCRTRAVGGNQQRGCNDPPIGKRDVDRRGALGCRHHPPRRDDRHIGQIGQAREKRPADGDILHD